MCALRESPDPPAFAHLARSIPLVLVVITLLVFGRASMFEFSQWDDWLNVINNKYYHPPEWSNIANVWWDVAYFGQYLPIVYTLWGMLCRIAPVETPGPLGELFNPYPFHLTNILLHTLNVLLVWQLARKIIGQVWPAFAVALLWAVHPLQAEPVAWITGLKDILAGCFSILTILAYLAFVDRKQSAMPRAWAWYGLATFLMACALLSKPTSVVVPLVIGILVLYRTGGVALALPMLAWLALVIPVTYGVATGRMAEQGRSYVWSPLWLRPIVAWDAISFYLWKLWAPIELCTDYGRRPDVVWDNPRLWRIWIFPFILLSICFCLRKRGRWVWLAPAIFVASLLPVLGLMPFEYQTRSTPADRYAYLALLGPMIAFGFLLAQLPRKAAVIGTAILATIFCVRSFAQTAVWRDSASLFSHVISINPNSWIAYNNLALLEMQEGRLGDAERHFRQTIALFPSEWKPYYNLARVLREQGRAGDARLPHAQAMKILAELNIRYDPEKPDGYFGLGQALEMLDDRAGAIASYEHAQFIQPGEHRSAEALARLRTPDTSAPTPMP